MMLMHVDKPGQHHCASRVNGSVEIVTGRRCGGGSDRQNLLPVDGNVSSRPHVATRINRDYITIFDQRALHVHLAKSEPQSNAG